jgi:hypothetical protein
MWRRPTLRGDIVTLARIGVAAVAYVTECEDLRRELAATKAERDELRAAIVDVLNARRDLRQASAEVRRLSREHAIERAQATERDPALPLN